MLEQEGLKLVVRAIELVDQQDRGHWIVMGDHVEEGPTDEKRGAEELVDARCLRVRLGRPDVLHLPGVVPVVKRVTDIRCLVGLQADQPRPQDAGERLRELNLLHAGLPSSSSGFSSRIATMASRSPLATLNACSTVTSPVSARYPWDASRAERSSGATPAWVEDDVTAGPRRRHRWIRSSRPAGRRIVRSGSR